MPLTVKGVPQPQNVMEVGLVIVATRKLVIMTDVKHAQTIAKGHVPPKGSVMVLLIVQLVISRMVTTCALHVQLVAPSVLMQQHVR